MMQVPEPQHLESSLICLPQKGWRFNNSLFCDRHQPHRQTLSQRFLKRGAWVLTRNYYALHFRRTYIDIEAHQVKHLELRIH